MVVCLFSRLAFSVSRYFKTPSAGDFCAVSAVLRMSSKYLIDHLRERCLARLEADWPTTLLGWDRREQKATVDTRYNPREHFPHPVLVIQLAHELSLDQLLPCAFYDLCRYGPRKIAAGASTIPSLLPPKVLSQAHPPIQPHSTSASTAGPIVQLRLSKAHLRVTFLGREAGQRFLADFIQRELHGRAISANCANRNHAGGHHCRESYYFIMLNLLRAVSGIATGRDADPLFSLMQAVEMLSRTDFSDGTRQCGLRICASCKEDFSLAVAKARKDAWDLIPEWFGLREKSGGEQTSLTPEAEQEKVESAN